MRDLAGHPEPGSGGDAWALAALALTALAVDPHGLGGAVLRAWPGPARDAWLDGFRALLPEAAPWRRLPPGTADDRALGGLDLAATLASGRPVAQPGVLAEADGGVVIVPGAERLAPRLAAHLGHALDRGVIATADEAEAPARIAVLALDEGATPDERAPEALADRLAFRATLDHVPLAALEAPAATRAQVAAARRLLPRVRATDEEIAALATAAAALGVASPRASLHALRTARAFAALDGREALDEGDLAFAVQLVLAPRATMVPAEEPDEPETPEPPPPDDTPDTAERPDNAELEDALRDMLLEAALAVLPPDVLAMLKAGGSRQSAGQGGAAGQTRASALRGRPLGSRPGRPGGGRRTALLETLRAAAPWQPIRRRDRGVTALHRGTDAPRLEIRRDDLRIRRFREKRETLTVFAVDASGSAALARLAEAKGAVELLLGEAYRRRDQVALVAFRRETAELLLPPTRALARARRALSGLPGGGATPLAAGIDMARALAATAISRGQTVTVVFLTDGKANIARDGAPGRAQARADAETAARALAATGAALLVIDTNPRPAMEAKALAAAMQARHLALPRADARALAAGVRAVQEAAR